MQTTDDSPVGTAEACETLGVSKDTLIRMIARGEISAHKMPGLRGPYVIDRAELIRVAAELAEREQAKAAAQA
jgi:excisionase family DNA binding protein